MAVPQTQRSVPEVLQDIVGNLQMIIRSEFRLAKTELTESAQKAARPAAIFGIGLALGFYALGALLLAAVYGLSRIMPGWAASLLVGTVLALVATALTSSSVKKLKFPGTADRTLQSMEDNVQWAKHQIK